MTILRNIYSNLYCVCYSSVFTAIDLKDHVANIDTLLEEESKAVAEAKKQDIEAAQLEAQSG